MIPGGRTVCEEALTEKELNGRARQHISSNLDDYSIRVALEIVLENNFHPFHSALSL